MPEDIKGLIEKIKEEGIIAAQKKADDIEREALKRAEGIVRDAKDQAKQLVSQAEAQTSRMQAAAEENLRHAGRDLLLSMRTSVQELFMRIVAGEVREALQPEELVRILSELIQGNVSSQTSGVVVSISAHDFEKVERHFLGQLSEEIKKGVTLRASDEISSGFRISYDQGKSHFDFTDEALTQYICTTLEPKLNALLEGALGEKHG